MGLAGIHIEGETANMEQISYVLGIDGGATKTHALLLDSHGHCLGFGEAGSGNHQVFGLKPALKEIQRASLSAITTAGLSPSDIRLGYFCLAGADLPEDYSMLQEAIEGLELAQSVVVKNDTMAALRSGLTRSWGVVVVCGTGFNAAGRAPDGREIILPGLGPISGDWGGGYALSQDMIRMIMRAWDGRGKPTLLTSLVLSALNVPSEEVLLAKLYHGEIQARSLTNLVPLLFEAAEAGDEVARELIIKMGTEVGITASTLIRRLFLEQEEVEVVLAGGVFKGKGSLLLDTVLDVVCQVAPKARIVRPRYEPVVGAALLALEAMGICVNHQHYLNLESTLPIFLMIGSRVT